MSDSKTEIAELIAGLADLALDIKSVLADGKVDMADLSLIPKLMGQQTEIIAAFEGLGNIKLGELKAEDYVAIVMALVEAGKKVAA